MPPLLFLAAGYGVLLAGVGFVCWIAGTPSTSQQQTRDLALKRIVALDKQRGRWLTFHLTNGKTTAGRLVEIDSDLLIVYLDVRRPKRQLETGALEYSEDPPVMTDLTDVDLGEAEMVEVYSERVAS